MDSIIRDYIEEKNSLSSDILFLSNQIPSENGKFFFCKSWSRTINTGRKPNNYIMNSFDFPELPGSLKFVESLEEILFCPRLTFMIIKSLDRIFLKEM